MERKEAWAIVIAVLTLSIVLYFPKLMGASGSIGITSSIIISGLIILTAVYSKTLVAKYIDDSVTYKIWEFKRFWITYHAEFKNPVPIGVLLPIIISFFSNGMIKFLAVLQYESQALPSKVTKRYGRRRFSQIMEWDDALIVFYSMVAIFVLACAARFGTNILPSNFLSSLARYSLYYAAANLIPFGKLDGTKLFMGSKPLYVFTLILLVVSGLVVFF